MEKSKEEKNYGLWPSAITKEAVAEKTLRFGITQYSEDLIYWTETRPHEAGRSVIMQIDRDGNIKEVLPSPYSARSRIHEYGGAEFYAHKNDIFFVNASDQDIYLLKNQNIIKKLTNTERTRFADFQLHESSETLIFVTEEHSNAKKHPINTLSCLNIGSQNNKNINAIHSEHDFYAYPRGCSKSNKLAWIAWDLPNMPWDSSYLYVCDIDTNGSILNINKICDGNGYSVTQPEWGPDGRLYFISDQTGWANLYVYDGENITPVFTANKDFGRPLWGLGTRSYAFTDGGQIIASCFDNGSLEVLIIDPVTQATKSLTTPLRSLENICCRGKTIFGIGTTDYITPSIISLCSETEGFKVIQQSSPIQISNDDISVARKITINTRSNDDIYGLYYPPTNVSYKGNGSPPPLIIFLHGGPTGCSDRGVKLKIQYWTNKGFAVFDLDYSGSTGYGRAYKERLDANWGIRDIEDIQDSVDFLCKQELADPDAIAITGGSAGGFSVLLALAKLDIFAVGSSSYGVADLLHLQSFTHKFEAGYLFQLLGIPPESSLDDFDKKIFIERSPVSIAHKIKKPVIFFQGLDDKIVPPEQTRSIVKKLQEHNPDVLSVEFEEEGHGFRKTDTVKRVLEYEYLFFKKHMKL